MAFPFRIFEKWIDPFRTPDSPPPSPSGLKMLLYFVAQARLPFVGMLILGGATAAIEATLYVFIGYLVDLVDGADPTDFFADNWPALVGMAITVIVVRTIVAALTAILEEQTVVPHFFTLVRWQAHQQIMDQSLGYFQDDFSGRLAQKVMQSGQAAGDFMISLLQTVWYIVVYAATTLFLVSKLDLRLGGLVLIWLVGFFIIARYFIPRIRAAAKELANAASGVSGRLVDTYTNIQSVKLFGSRDTENSSVRASFENFIRFVLRFTRLLSSVRSLMALMNGTMIVLIAGTALYLWQGGLLSAGDVAFSLGLVLRLNMLLGRLLGQLNGLFRSMGTLQDSMETIIKPVAVVDREAAVEADVSEGRIAFEGVRFHYGKSKSVIDNLNLTIEPGERVGIVGPSGAGKSTLANLLLRFYDVEAGRITIDGLDLRDMTQASLRKSIGMVTQDTSLLHRSIGDNIRYGRPEASDEEVRDAARRAHALGFIESQSDKRGRKGFDAHVGERGVKLSGGQRQRIAIARVLLKNAPILVLDEATSALDSDVEAAIQENLIELMQGKTVIAIAHRLSTIANLDRLVVLDKGRIVQSGSHDALLQETDGLYARLWSRQSGGFLNDEDASSGETTS